MCDVCQKSFKNRAPYLEHIHYGHTDEPTVKCVFCGKMYWMPTQRDNHIRAYHTKVPKAPKRKAMSTVSKPPDNDDPQQQQAVPGNAAVESVDNAPEDPMATYQGDTDKYTLDDAEHPLTE